MSLHPATEWQEKLEFLLEEEARLADPAQKFQIRKQIEEAERKIREHRSSPPSAVPRDTERERRGRQLEELYERWMTLELSGKDVTGIREQIKDVRRLLYRGPVLESGDFLADGRFKLGRLAGQGGFATVWQAADRTGGIVALKVLHAHHGQDQSRRERFFRGARRMAALRHQQIVVVHEAEHEDEGWYFFVMEYVDGGTFEEAILAGRLTRSDQLTVLLQAGDALAFAHGRGVVHRDVKPSNVLLTRAGLAKLTDFDLVRADDSTGFTATQAMMGTLQFAAPEALHSAAEADGRADLYSLASTAVFALVEGRLPSIYYRDPARVIADLPVGEDLRAVLSRATSFDRSERFATVEEFCEALAGSWPGRARVERQGDSQRVDKKAHPDRSEPSRGYGWRGGLIASAFILVLVILRNVFFPDFPNVSLPESHGVGESTPPVAHDVKESNSPVTHAADESTPPVTHHMEESNRMVQSINGVDFAWRRIERGKFQMGSPPEEPGRFDDEALHEVILTHGFLIGETEVTQGQWQTLMGNHPSVFADCGAECPVERVNWYEAVAFANALSRSTELPECYELLEDNGKIAGEGLRYRVVNFRGLTCRGYRLPTEAEWEYAARASTKTPYWFGETLLAYQANCGGGELKTVKVRSFGANHWGLFEVHGNVYEWVQDAANLDGMELITETYRNATIENPLSREGSRRVIRGGSFDDDARFCRAASRFANSPVIRHGRVGFRVLRTLP